MRTRAYVDICDEADAILAAYVMGKLHRPHLSLLCDTIVGELADDMILDDDTPLSLLQRIRAVIAGLPHQAQLPKAD